MLTRDTARRWSGLADLIIAEDAIAAEVLDAKLLLRRPLAANVDLFFAQHGFS